MGYGISLLCGFIFEYGGGNVMRIAQYSNIDLHWWGNNLFTARPIRISGEKQAYYPLNMILRLVYLE